MDLEDKWKKAEEDLKKFNESMELIKKFNESMELIKKYPIKVPFKEVKCQPYTIEGPVEYQSSFF